MSSSDIQLWNSKDYNPLLDGNNDMDTVQFLWVNTSKFTTDQLTGYAELPKIGLTFVPAPSIDNPVTINVNAVAIGNIVTLTDSNQVQGQFDNGVNTTFANLLVYFCDYKAYGRKFKCPVKLTGTVGSKHTKFII